MNSPQLSNKSGLPGPVRLVCWPHILTLFLLFFVMAGCRQKELGAGPPAPKADGDTVVFASNAPQLSLLAVQAAEARTTAIVRLTGRLYWNDDTTVRIFTPVAGRVMAIHVDLGDPISAGTALADINSPDFGQALANARIAVGNLATADRAFARSNDLFEHGAAARKDVEAAEAAYIAALAERDRAEAVLANYGGSNKGTNSVYILRSPLAGELVDKNINPGQEIRADMMLANAPNFTAPIFVVSDPAKLWLQVDVAEPDIPYLHAGQQLRIYSPAFPGRAFEGTVAKVGATLDPATRTVKVRGVVNNPDKLLKTEMYVTVDVLTDTAKNSQAGVEIATKAIFLKDDRHYLFIETASGQFQRRGVKVDMENDGHSVVVDGLAAGQRVVTDGCLLLEAILEGENP